MEPLDFTRSRALNNIPAKKMQDKLTSVQDSDDKPDVKNVKLIAYNRYEESNIPMGYWDLKMDKDFIGDTRLKEKYDEYVADIKQSYTSGSSICLAGNHGVGKQLALDTEIPTPNGFVKLIDLKEGDQLFDENGSTCRVLKLHPIDLLPESYRIIFDDGTIIEACADHLWLTYTRSNRTYGTLPTVKSTKEILDTLRFKNGEIPGSNHSIPCCKPLKYHSKELLIDPYVLGCWLGDGTSKDGSIECADQEILNNIVKSGYSITLSEGSVGVSKSCRYRIGDLVKNELTKQKSWIGLLRYQLKQLNLENNKHIPKMYLQSSYEQRLSLLQGLMDTNGCCLKGGLSEFTTKIPEMAYQFAELVRSLGIKCNINRNESWLYDKQCADRYRITFTTQLLVFRLQRKLENIRTDKSQLNRTAHRYIINVEPIEPKAMRCITVDSPSHLFLVTRSFIATHNTMAVTCILKKACQKGYSCLYTNLSDIVAVLTQASGEDKFLARQELVLVDFLVIDEVDNRFFGQSIQSNELFARSFESIIRVRLQNNLPILMATNSPNIKESFTSFFKDSLSSIMTKIPIFYVGGDDFRKHK